MAAGATEIKVSIRPKFSQETTVAMAALLGVLARANEINPEVYRRYMGRLYEVKVAGRDWEALRV